MPTADFLRLSRRRGLFFSRLLRIRRQDRVQRVAFLSRTKFNDSAIANIFNQPIQNPSSQAGTRHLASTEEDCGLDLIALIQKAQHVVLLGLVVVIVHVDAKLHFLNCDRLLVLLGFAFLFLLLVQKFPIIHDAANRRLRGGRNLYQIQILFAGHLERFKGRQDSDLLTFVANHANFARPNTIIYADKSLIDTKPPYACKRRGIKKYSMGLPQLLQDFLRDSHSDVRGIDAICRIHRSRGPARQIQGLRTRIAMSDAELETLISARTEQAQAI